MPTRENMPDPFHSCFRFALPFACVYNAARTLSLAAVEAKKRPQERTGDLRNSRPGFPVSLAPG